MNKIFSRRALSSRKLMAEQVLERALSSRKLMAEQVLERAQARINVSAMPPHLRAGAPMPWEEAVSGSPIREELVR